MGFKRHFDDAEFQELHFKQARLQDFGNRSTQFAEKFSRISSPKIPDSAVDSHTRNEKPLWHEALENAVVPSNSTDSDESLSPEYPEYNPQRRYTPFNSFSLPYYDRFPRKQIPLGSNHQASIPSLLELGGSSDEEKKLMGSCVIPMPETDSVPPNPLEFTRPDCSCLDAGSLRCVRQHITESRYKLKKVLGQEKFSGLGFNSMGEEVAWRWSEDEERHFRSVIYSNPVSSGRNFWKLLAHVFPTRPMKEIVSYYFNVFMLRKRAAQNRSDVLDVDSDDDELHGVDVGPYEGDDSDDDDDSGVESPVEEYGQLNCGEEIVTEDDDDDDNDDDDGDGSGDMAYGYGDVKVEEVATYDSKFGAREKCEEADLIVQENSCSSFEFQAYKDEDSCYLMGSEAAAIQGNEVNCLSGKADGCSYMMDVGPMMDFRDDEVLYRLYSSPDYLEAEKDEPCCKPVAAAAGGATDAMDLVPMLDFRDEKAWDVIFPGSL